jgi:hypothetical protein
MKPFVLIVFVLCLFGQGYAVSAEPSAESILRVPDGITTAAPSAGGFKGMLRQCGDYVRQKVIAARCHVGMSIMNRL